MKVQEKYSMLFVLRYRSKDTCQLTVVDVLNGTLRKYPRYEN